MQVIMILVGLAVLVGVFFAATGRGGELSHEQPDHAPLDLGPVSATDVALLRPPTALLGYNVPVTDEALERIARAMRERDVRIAYLQQQLADLIAEAARRPEAPRAPVPGIPPPHTPQQVRPADRGGLAGQEDPAGPAAGGYRGRDEPAGPAAPAAGEAEELEW